MKRYRMRPELIDAIQFDGTAAGVERVAAWMGEVAPGLPIRPRTEYAGWDDLVGHLELEMKDSEHGCMAGDWVVVAEAGGRQAALFVDDVMFRRYYEEVEG